MMPLGAPSISKYGSLVQPNARIVALCALKAPPITTLLHPVRHPIHNASARPPRAAAGSPVTEVDCMRHRMNMGMCGFPITISPTVASVSEKGKDIVRV